MPESLRLHQVYPLEIIVSKENRLTNTSLSMNGIELSLVGMTESGLQGLTYLANPQRINMTEVTTVNGTLYLTVGKDANVGKYTVAPRITTVERDNLTISLSLPQTVRLDTPTQNDPLQNIPAQSNQVSSDQTFVLLRDIARYGSISVAIALIRYLGNRKIKIRGNDRNMVNKR